MNVLIAAGGTGGHVYPALAVAQALLLRGHVVHWVGNPDSFESRAVAKTAIPLHPVPVRALRGKGLVGVLTAPLTLLRAVASAIRVVRAVQPAVVLGMGGFVSGPAGLAAWLMRVPLVIHEQNARAGLTNRLLARLARRVLLGFDGALGGGVWVGNPVRADVAGLPHPSERFADRNGPLRLLVLGGSQGAMALNRTVPKALATLPDARRPLVRHQAGRTLDVAEAAYAEAGVVAELSPFIDDMADAFAWADLVVARAGASTLAELSACGLGGVLVPYPHAVDDHQTANAQVLVAAGAVTCLAEPAFDATRLAQWLSEMNRTRALALAEAALRVARPDATRDIADALEAAGDRS
jgi:UDP-N-acetylglucosamine--N-acetylmuramyl-(pentapeptide) pyrophosphoryl-undecaprenol N-acetylglucosamine transferase